MHIVVRAFVNAIAAARLTCMKTASRAPRADLALERIDHFRVMVEHAIGAVDNDNECHPWLNPPFCVSLSRTGAKIDGYRADTGDGVM